MFSKLTPYATAAARQPIFQQETRRLPWAGDARALVRLSVRRIVRVALISMAAVCVVGMLVMILSELGTPSSQRSTAMRLFDAIPIMLFSGAFVLGLIGLIMGLQVDFHSISASITLINGDVMTGRWDLYRLAGIREGHFTVGKHGVAQMRAWRTVMNVIGVRIGAIILYVVSSAINAFYIDSYLGAGSSSTSVAFLEFVLSIILILTSGWFFLIEPILRLRMMTAIGLMVSAHVREPNMSPLAGFGVTFGLWVMQLAILGAMGCGGAALFFPLLLFGGGICGIPVLFGLLIAALYAYYDIFKNYALRRVAFRLARLESTP